MEHAIEIIGTFVGFIYLWLEYKASIYLWIASIVMPAIYLYIFYEAGLYADFGINIYYLLIAIYGWFAWKYGGGQEKTALPISHIGIQSCLKLGILFIATFIGIAWLLTNFTDSTVPWWDSFTTALSIVGMWMLARKYIEQWWVWMVVDVVSVGLYTYKELYATALLYAFYAAICVLGYRKWKELMRKE